MSLTIDCRLWNNSGIGRYIRDLVPYVVDDPELSVNLLTNNEINIDGDISSKANDLIKLKSSYYSISEQLEIPLRTSGKELLWVPHYNFPALRKYLMIVTVHDMAHIALRNLVGSHLKDIYSHFMFNLLPRKADKVICVSKFTKKELISYTGMADKKIEVIHNGLAESWHKVEREENPHGRPYILFIGNIKPHKNLKVLVEAFLAIRNKIPHDLVLVGQKEAFLTKDDEIDSLVAKAPDRIKFTGYVSDDLLKQYYAFADLFVFPSLYEGFGFPPLEAMACGTPVIASCAAAIPEICGDAACYFDPREVDELIVKIEKVLSDEILKRKLIKKGKEQSRKFTVKRSAKKTIKVLKNIL